MFHFNLLLLAGCALLVCGHLQPGFTIPDIFEAPIIGKLESMVNACGTKGLKFNAEKINKKIASCYKLFDQLGQQLHDYPDAVRPNSWKDEIQVRAYNYERVKEQQSLIYMKNTCNQLHSTIQCLEPVKAILNECQSPEGITFFALGEQICQDDAQPFLDFFSSRRECGGSKEFQDAYGFCLEELEEAQKYMQKAFDPFDFINDFCGIGSIIYKCFRKSFFLNPTGCARASEGFQTFVAGILTRASNVDTLAQCIS